MLYIAKDTTRGFFYISGPDRVNFLQDLISNDMGHLTKGCPLYAALLNPQGKYLFDFILIDQGEQILIDVAKECRDALMGRLNMYKLRRDITITKTTQTLMLLWGEGLQPKEALQDPRDKALGWRYYEPLMTNTAYNNYDIHRIKLGIPETGRELIANQSYILECGFEHLNGVDFNKGCYVGQEITARMKHKTTLRKGLACVHIDGDAEYGTPITVGDKTIGTLYSVAGENGIAYLRFDRIINQSMYAGNTPVHLIAANQI